MDRTRGGGGEREICTSSSVQSAAKLDSKHLTINKRTHTGAQTFLMFSGLTRYLCTLSGDRSYTCTTCGQAFSLCGNMVRHMRTYSGDRPHCEMPVTSRGTCVGNAVTARTLAQFAARPSHSPAAWRGTAKESTLSSIRSDDVHGFLAYEKTHPPGILP